MNGVTPAAPQGFSAFGDWISETFRLWGARWQVWVLQGLIFFAITVVLAVIINIVSFGIGSLYWAALANPQATPIDAAVFGTIGTLYGIIVLSSLVSMALYPGMVRTALKQIRGEQIRVADLFSGVRYLWGFLVVTILVGLGVLACFVGAYILMSLLFLALPLMIDRGLRTGEAISQS